MTTELVTIVAVVLGAAIGLAADRLSVRWPEHEDDYVPRGVDWRTALVTLTGAAAGAGLAGRWDDPRDLLLLGIFAAALVVLLATDLDQRLLPDLVTLPLIAYAGVLLLLGVSPLLAGRELGQASGIAAGIGAPVLLLVSDRVFGGGLGGGDLKLAAAIGLLTGVTLLFAGFLVASLGFALVLIALMVAGRIGRRSFVPYGPVLIGAALVAMVIA